MTRIMIIGGGIAGTAAALALHKAGAEVTVFEAHPDSGQDIGAFLTLASNGMRALAQFDAAEPVSDAGFPLSRLSLLGADGTELANSPLGASEHPLTRYRCLRRAHLATALRAEARRRGIPLRHGHRLDGLGTDDSGVTARFTDGSTATGDLLIGADGLHSTVRSRLLPDTTARYAGQQVFYGYTTAARPPAPAEHITMIRGNATAFGYAVSPDGQTYWFARVSEEPLPAEKIAAATPSTLRARLLPLLRRDHTPAADIVAASDEELMVTNAQHLPLGVPWRHGRTLLIGDAAHAASPATGQGASMALEDAVILAKALRDTPTIDTALARYERLRRARVEHNITISAKLTAARKPATKPGSPEPSADQAGPAPVSDEELATQLDWDTPLPG